MIIDPTGTVLIPGKQGEDCPGNGAHMDEYGNLIECCCGGCDYMMCCLPTHTPEECASCTDPLCPHGSNQTSASPATHT